MDDTFSGRGIMIGFVKRGRHLAAPLKKTENRVGTSKFKSDVMRKIREDLR